MRVATIALVFLGASLSANFAQAQNAPGAPTRMVLAAAKLSSVVDAPLYFDVVQIELPAGGKTPTARSASILFGVSGSTQVLLNGESKMINAGEALFLPSGAAAELQPAGDAASTVMRFSLEPAAEVRHRSETAPAKTKQLYHTRAAIPELKPGPYDITLTKSSFPAAMANNRPHHRTGAALYYIVSGTGANTVDGKTQSRGPGSFIYEPAPLIHQWGNPGNEPLVILQFNINPEGQPAVAFESAPAK